ncbi:MAG: DUF1566 domain-containing protein [Desulfobulbus sp.]|jgi:hypothetical protein|nr:DUF1566 domain-containing protein [Desulfobulbus sp.]
MRHVLHTGQTRCWDASGLEVPCRGSGQDGEWQRGTPWPAERFVVRGEVVTDGLTGLHWCRDATVGTFPCTWAEAFALIDELNRERYGGRDDWRLPNRNELRSLMSYQARKPALAEGHPFVNVFLGWYWTSTTAAISPAYAWAVHLEGARMFYGRKDQEYLCWPVCGAGNGLLPRTGQRRCIDAGGVVIDCRGRGQDGELQTGAPWPEPRFTVTGEVVRDRLTGLSWARRADMTNGSVAWQEALDRVSAWNDEHGTAQLVWRLPTINELASLVDCDAHSPALPTGHPFIGLQDGYWSATTSFFECDWAWVLYLDKGACGVGHKPGRTFFLWPVGVPVSG